MILIIVGSFTCAHMEAVPAQVLLIRHAEKPLPPDKEGIHLNMQGRQRAHALVPFFMEDPRMTELGTPVVIFAQKPKTKKNSRRPIETVKPLAEALGLEVNTTFHRDQVKALVDEILMNPEYEGKTVLVCWGHEFLGKIATALGVDPNVSTTWGRVIYDTIATSISGDTKEKRLKWPKTYDRVWVISYHDNGEVEFKDIPQRLLYGDSDN